MDIESKKNLNINLSINNYAVYPGSRSKNEQRKLETFSESKRREAEKRCQTQND